MEAYAIMLAIPASLVAVIFYTFVIVPLVRRSPALSRLFFIFSEFVIVGLILEILLVIAMKGPVAVRVLIGPTFERLHWLVTYLAVPALINLLCIRTANTDWRIVAIIPGVILGLGILFFHMYVSESLYGIDGDNGPYSRKQAAKSPD